MSAPKVKLTPRSFSPQPWTSLSGSLHNKSHNKPVSGTSVGLIIRRICSMPCKSGDNLNATSIKLPINLSKNAIISKISPSVTTENLLVNDSSNGQAVEAICECLPQFDIVSTLTLIIKSYRDERGERERKKIISRREMKDEKLDFPSFFLPRWKISRERIKLWGEGVNLKMMSVENYSVTSPLERPSPSLQSIMNRFRFSNGKSKITINSIYACTLMIAT